MSDRVGDLSLEFPLLADPDLVSSCDEQQGLLLKRQRRAKEAGRVPGSAQGDEKVVVGFLEYAGVLQEIGALDGGAGSGHGVDAERSGNALKCGNQEGRRGNLQHGFGCQPDLAFASFRALKAGYEKHFIRQVTGDACGHDGEG